VSATVDTISRVAVPCSQNYIDQCLTADLVPEVIIGHDLILPHHDLICWRSEEKAQGYQQQMAFIKCWKNNQKCWEFSFEMLEKCWKAFTLIFNENPSVFLI
jgi:hypothetical protein